MRIYDYKKRAYDISSTVFNRLIRMGMLELRKWKCGNVYVLPEQGALDLMFELEDQEDQYEEMLFEARHMFDLRDFQDEDV